MKLTLKQFLIKNKYPFVESPKNTFTLFNKVKLVETKILSEANWTDVDENLINTYLNDAQGIFKIYGKIEEC